MEKFKAVYYERVSTVHFEQADRLPDGQRSEETFKVDGSLVSA